jgi:ribonuclease-3
MSVADLQERLGYVFSDTGLLRTALTHRSYSAEFPAEDHNERFEFLGDAVLQLSVTDFLFAEYPEHREGKMAKVRAACVSGEALAGIAAQLDLGASIRLGKGEIASNGRHKDSILADTMEAVIAAVYLDAGMQVAKGVVRELWEGVIRDRALSPGQTDYKTRLQELLAQSGLVPKYELTGAGPDHQRTFTALVSSEGRVIGRGVGASKKEAQQSAANDALRALAK